MAVYLSFMKGAINKGREAAINQLVAEIENHISSHLQKKCNVHTQTSGSCLHLAKSGHYMEELRRLALWPLSRIASEKSIQDVLTQLDEFMPFTDDPDNPNREYSCNGGDEQVDMLLEDTVATTKDRVHGLCLNCAKMGKVTWQEENCKANDLEDCKNRPR